MFTGSSVRCSIKNTSSVFFLLYHIFPRCQSADFLKGGIHTKKKVALCLALTAALLAGCATSTASAPAPTPTPIPIDEYKALCSEIDYKTVARSPSQYVGKYLKIQGKVVQVQGESDAILRVNQNDDLNQTWYVTGTMLSNYRVLDGDSIIMYGECSGTTTYNTVLGAEITVPSLKMQYYVVWS